MRSSLVTRLTSLVLALCFGVFTLEALIADVCDGDAPAAEVARLATDASAHPGLAAATAVVGTADQHDGAPADAQGSGHATHVCHCGHAHATMSVAAAIPAWRAALLADARPEPATRLVSADRADPLRPPIA